MRFFAVRHVPSQKLLPRRVQGVSQTRRYPTNHQPPELYMKHRNAKAAMTWYCKGRWRNKVAIGFLGEPKYQVKVEAGTARNAADYEIVAITLTIEERATNETEVEAAPGV